MKFKIFSTPVEALRAMVRGVQFADVNAVPEDALEEAKDLEQHIFYCKVLNRVVTPAECAAHFKRMKSDKILNRADCINDNSVREGYEKEIHIKAVSMVYYPLYMIANREAIDTIKEMREWQNKL